MTRILHRLLVLLALVPGVMRADWRTSAGWDLLGSELGAARPNGTGIPVLQCEADADGVDGAPYCYLPQIMTTDPWAGTGTYAGKTFHLLGGIDGASGHADSVCNTMASFAGISPGITTIYSHEAYQFYHAILDSVTPPSFSGRGVVQNHSWIGIAQNSAEVAESLTMMRRYDFMLDRDSILGVVALNNGNGAVPELLAPSYHAICAGVLSGSHSNSGTTANHDGPDRMKPDLVVDQPYTSLAAPSIASAASVLYDAIRPAFPGADHPQAVKAILLAAASKDHLPAWHRQSAASPYDALFGAGELNVFNAHHILAAGRQPSSATIEVAALGWDYTTASSTTARRYFFTIPAGRMADTFSAALTWHRNVADITFTSTVPNLTLRLYPSASFTPAASPIDQSTSSVDNVQHLWLRNLPPGQYMLEVTSDTNDQIYALAWEARLGSGPSSTSRRDTSGQVLIDFAGLDPFVTYTVETSTTLTPSSWTTAGTFRTADTTPSTAHTWQDPAPSPPTQFYRLRWTAVR